MLKGLDNDFKQTWKKRIPFWRKDILQFAREVLKTEPDSLQKKFLKVVPKYDFIALRSGHGIGKTYCDSIIVPWFISVFPDSRVITTAPTFRQVQEVTWSEIHKQCANTVLKKLMEFQTTKIKLKGTEHWGAIGASSGRQENIEGFHADNLLFLVDEAKGVMQAIFDSVMGTQTTKTKIIINSTPSPNPLGEFYNAFKPNSIYNPPRGINMHFTCLESPRPGMKAYIDIMKKKYGENSQIYQMKVMGDFPEAGEDTLIPWKHVNAAINRELTIDAQQEYKRIISCDVARFGQDKTVIMVIESQKTEHGEIFKLVDMEDFEKKPTNYTAGRIAEMDKKWHANEIRVDAGGGDLGAGVVDQLMLSPIDFKVVPFVAGGTRNFNEADKDYYLNWKSKGYDNLRILFEQGRIDIKDVGDLCEQLILLRRDYTTGQKLKILDYEEEIKQNPDIKHKSPDYSDALSIGCAPLHVTNYGTLKGME